MPRAERTYATFEEADAAADAEKAAQEASQDYGSAGQQDSAFKSAFRAGGQSRPSDGFARVTWTDLAAKGGFGKKQEEPQKGLLRPGSRGGMTAGLEVSPSVANFSLAQRDKHQESYEEIKGDADDAPVAVDDEDAPQTFKANFVRRNTVLRQQILESDDSVGFLGKKTPSSVGGDSASDRPRSGVSASRSNPLAAGDEGQDDTALLT